MKEKLDDLQKQYAQQLEMAAFGYLTAGLGHFYSERTSSAYVELQSVIGNLAIAVELALKAFIARKSLLLLLNNIPLEIRALLTCPTEIPSAFNWRAFEIDLRSASYTTIEFNECISLFYIFFPDERGKLQSHLKFLSKSRNASVHSVLASFQRNYELERAAYTALKICQTLRPTLIIIGSVAERAENKRFVEEFQENVGERVQKAIESAKERAKKLPTQSSKETTISADLFKQEIIDCPICGNPAILDGSTEKMIWTKRGDKDIQEPGLWFYPESFHCRQCGLTLNGYDELKFVGMDEGFDRTENLDDFENGAQVTMLR